MSQTSRIDTRMGIEERVCFFGPRPVLFGCVHAPVTPAIATIVFCPPVDADFHLSYRKHVLVARFLAAAGIAVQRFHYRGTGNSYGNGEDTTFEGLVDDALRAADLVLPSAQATAVAFLGAGWGALVAAAAAARFPGASLILWQPVTDPARYYREAVLAAMTHETVATWSTEPRREILEELERNGAADIVGYTIHRRLYETSKRRTLVGELGSRPRPVLLIDPVGRHSRRKEYDVLVDALLSQGFSVDVAALGKPDAVWFHGQHGHMQTDTAREVAHRVHTWLVRKEQHE